jgi:hypothetical protein
VETSSILFGILLGLGWGIAYAVFLQFTALGRYIVARVTWLSVVIGVGVDLLIAGPLLGWNVVIILGAIIGASSIGIIARSLINYQQAHVEFERILDAGAEDSE